MRTALVQALGIAVTLTYGAFIAWVYATQPRTLQEVATGAQVAAGVYEVDEARFQAGLQLFRREQFRAARDEWARADPAQRDPRIQLYVAYSFYREGWGRLHHDDALYREGLAAVSRARALAPGGAVAVNDPGLGLRTAAELEAELRKGIERTWSDLDPRRVLEERK
jgi:hypothetical protein